MVNTSKILTVSYGTFSCTLEGFDDSFETMKAIAEYFRDLAADDRYFGAEPPTPDADMLARIAEREIARRVEAHEEQGKIVLRAGVAPAIADGALSEPAAAPAPVEPQAEEAVQEAVDETPVEEFEEPVAELPEEETAEAETVEAEEDPVVPESVASEDEAPADVALEAAPDVAMDALIDMEPATDASVEAVAEEDVPAESVAEENTPVELAAEEDDVIEPVAEEIKQLAEEEPVAQEATEAEAIESEDAFFQNSPEPDAPAIYEGEEAETPVADPESVAAKLSRIRSVVSQNDQPYEADDYNEDEHAQDFLNETAADLDAALAMDDATELEAEEQPEEQVQSDAELLKSLAGKRAREIEEMAATSADDVEETDTTDLAEANGDEGLEDTLSQLLADSVSAEDETDGSETSSGEVPVEELIEENTPNEALTDDDTPSEEAEVAQEEEASHDPLSARVIKMSNEDFEAALSDSMAAEDADDVASDEASEEVLSPEQEEDLQRALAQVEAELPSADDEAEVDEATDLAESVEAADDQEVAPAASLEGRHKFDAANGNSDIERIFDEADSQLEKPESNQRRSAIQHLRAAVAATRAEKKAGADLQKNVDDTPYRSDLASVVRPRRPSATDGARSERPAESRPAPLKLVAEQRVDTEQAPVRPRRVSAGTEQAEQPETAGASDSDFGDYARKMGATQLPELLEAAAAYMSDVEGRAQFSRPMLMHKLQEVEKENFSREDGLRSFGKLLRDGKIQKIKGGRFTVTEETEFRGEARHAG